MSGYVLLSDIHFHNFSSFSTVNERGINSRLAITIKEVIRAAMEQSKAKECDKNMIIAGDLFHVRGSLEPSVLNPVLDMFRMLTEKMGFEVYILAGNHDLEGKHCSRVSSAITAIELPGIHVVNEPCYFKEIEVAMIPWFESLDELRIEIGKMRERCGIADVDLIIHAPVNGVIEGLPDRGLSSNELAEFRFFRVFSGHYHNHVDFGNNVYSIGATTHQTWSDVGSKAGFLLVDNSSVTYRASHAPKFVDINENNVEEAQLLVDGNYVRIKVDSGSMSDIESIREELMGYGALGVIVNAINSGLKVERREVSTASSGITLEESIVNFIESKDLQPDHRPELNGLCLDILNSTEEV